MTQKSATPRWAKAYLAALAISGIVGQAAEVAKVNRRRVERFRTSNPDFASEEKAAFAAACDLLEQEARRRAFEGLKRKKFTAKGEPVIDPDTGQQYYEHEYSDGLIQFLLKARDPRFRDKVDVEHGGTVMVLTEEIVDADPPKDDPPASGAA